MPHAIPGTTLFDETQAMKGYALNRMCFSFNSAENRAAFLTDEDAELLDLAAEIRRELREQNVAVGGWRHCQRNNNDVWNAAKLSPG